MDNKLMLLTDPKEALVTVLKNAAPDGLVWDDVKRHCFNLLGTNSADHIKVGRILTSTFLSDLHANGFASWKRNDTNTDSIYFWVDKNWKSGGTQSILPIAKLDKPCRVCQRNCTPGDAKCWWCGNEKPC